MTKQSIHLAHVVSFLIVYISTSCGAFTLIRNPIIRKVKVPNNIIDGTSRLAASSVEVGELVGCGSYGTVHECNYNGEKIIGKRAWTIDELPESNKKALKEKVKRCEYYIGVEEHCFTKLGVHPQIPLYKGTFCDEKKRNWMIFDIIESSSALSSGKTIAPSLTDIIKLDHVRQLDDSESNTHHLQSLQKALNIDEKKPEDREQTKDDESLQTAEDSLGETLDFFFESLLEVLSYVHSKQIVHRDVKPGNLLITKDGVSLLDFGSAADMEPVEGKGLFRRKKYVGMDDEKRVAVSPVYAAPEIFIDTKRGPLTFDVFSAALIYCQLLFGFLDERADAGFHQQLAACDWDLEKWLDKQLLSKVRRRGLEEAIQVLSERPGLFRLLSDMFKRDPEYRIRSKQALNRFQKILMKEEVPTDGRFFQSVSESMDFCVVEPVKYRPLHFVASFKLRASLGLVLSETGEGIDSISKQEWDEATKDATPGQVFVKEIVEGGQASRMGIFEIGDNLQAVGELPLAAGGFQRVVELLDEQPAKSNYVTLHFDRKKAFNLEAVDGLDNQPVSPKDYGVWSLQGRRNYQEDRFILHEYQGRNNPVFVAGVMDGHGGAAASTMVSETLPSVFSSYYYDSDDLGISVALEEAWNSVCDSYRKKCESNTCVADYDEKEGVLDAQTSGEDIAAGSTTSIIALDENNGEITILNCGDSRSLIVDKERNLLFQTTDHSPQAETERLQEGIDQGLGYSLPECSMSRWFLRVGDYQYALARSLEGRFTTSKGIVSMPDMTTFQSEPGMTVIVATDGIFEVMDSEEVGHLAADMRKDGVSATDAAKSICNIALEKDSYDNLSVVIAYLD